MTKVDGTDYGTSNYYCNPSRIDGLSIINSSQGGGGMFIHGWAQNLEVANTRISGNHGTLAGGINLGNGETPDAFVNDGVECGTALTGANAAMPCPPIPYRSANGASYGSITNSAIPFQWNTKVHIHHNMIYNNASIGDALFSGTPAGAGAITISAGSEDYLIDHNWMAGNLSTGDGGGVQHLGLSFGGNINHNYILYNQSTNPTLPTNGGGLIVEGANIDRQLNGQECGSFTDQDCPPGLGEGAGSGTVIDGNLLLGNSAESGSGGGLRLQQVNGSDVVAFPTCPVSVSGRNGCQGGWYDVTVTNNIIANNVAGWDGGGVSLQDSLMVTFANNTVASNDTTASAGVLFKTLGAIKAASAPPGCDAQTDPMLPQDPSCTGNSAAHGGQPAGLVTMENTPNLIQAIAALGGSGSVSCPAGFGYTGNTGTNSNRNDCRKLSKPKIVNDLFWQNRSFSINIIGMGTGSQSQQNLIALTPLVNQGSTGACPAFPAANYWDIGLRTDDVASGAISKTNNPLTVTNSLYTSVASVASSIVTSTTNVVGSANPVVAQYCNGARVPPENCASQSGQVNQASCRGYNTPVGASETTSLSQVFAFNGIQPTATVDEGHNWLNLVYGPLTLSRPGVAGGATNAELMIASATIGSAQGAYSLPGGSPAVNRGTNTGLPATTANDFFGNHRAQTTANATDIGAVEYGASTGTSGAFVAPTNLGFGNVTLGTTSAAQTLTLTAGSANLTGTSITITAPYARAAGTASGTCSTAATFTLTANTSCTINVVLTPTAAGVANGTVTIGAGAAVSGSPVALSGTGSKVDLTVTGGPLLAFGDVFVGQSSAAQTVTVSNTSSPSAAVTGVSIAGLTGGPFARSGGSCPTTATFTLAAGGNCTINVTFTPTAGNPVTGTLTVGADSGFLILGSPLQMTGNGLLPTVTPASLNFGTVPVGTPVQQTLTLDNSANVNSNANFPVSTLAVAGTGYGRNGGTCGNAPFTLNAGSTCTIIVRFSQTGSATGVTPGTVTILGNANATSLPVVALTANSVAPTYTASLTPNALAFGNVIVTTSATQDLTVMNTGNSALGGVTINGITAPFTRVTNGGGFPAAAPNCGNTLAVGASCTIRVRFAPTAVAPASATVTVGGSGATSPSPVTAALSGAGTAPPVPGVPTNVNSVRGGNGGQINANLSWNAVQYASSYDVRWSTSPTFATSTTITNATSGTNYTFNGGANGLAANTTVYFQVRAVNITGAGGYSATFSSTVR